MLACDVASSYLSLLAFLACDVRNCLCSCLKLPTNVELSLKPRSDARLLMCIRPCVWNYIPFLLQLSTQMPTRVIHG